MKAGYWVVIPLGIERARRVVGVRLDFTPDGVLRDYEIQRGGHSPMNFLGGSPPEPPMFGGPT